MKTSELRRVEKGSERVSEVKELVKELVKPKS